MFCHTGTFYKMDNSYDGSGVQSEAKTADANTTDSDPEQEAEIKYAKEHGAEITNLPMRERIKLVREAKKVEEAARMMNGVVQVPRSQKNQRKSRTAKKKGGAAKKSGAGGKWTWGSPGDLFEEPEFVDSDDPNYDSDSHGAVRFKEIKPELGEGEFEHYVDDILAEYFDNGDLKNAMACLEELNLSKAARIGLVRLCVTLSIDGKPSARELASQLLAELWSSRLISEADAVNGFARLLRVDLPDLAIDYPQAADDIVGNFVARAVADEVLPAAFLNSEDKNARDKFFENPHAISSLDRAENLLLQKNRLDTIWCPGGGTRPVRYLVTKIKDLLEEYLSSGDVDEATRSLLELEVPHFHHEVVYQAGVRAIEAMHERVARLLSALLAHLKRVDALSGQQAIRVGFERVYAEMPELCLDMPPAYTLLDRWIRACQQHQGLLPDDVVRQMPQKGRKRIVSEGDGGQLKVVDVPHPLI